MLRTHRLLPISETLKSFDFYCNKEHELISLDTIIQLIGENKVIYKLRWLQQSRGVCWKITGFITEILIGLQEKIDSIQQDCSLMLDPIQVLSRS